MSRPTAPKFDLTFLCEKTKELVHVHGVTMSLKCPECGADLIFSATNRKLGAHGKSDKTVGHRLRSVAEG